VDDPLPGDDGVAMSQHNSASNRMQPSGHLVAMIEALAGEPISREEDEIEFSMGALEHDCRSAGVHPGEVSAVW
jgi:hypothetical protein